MTCIHIKHYPKVKDLIYPNITNNIDYYRNGNLYILPVYHGCGLRNRNSLKKGIDYSRGQQCILPSNLIGEEQKKNTNYRELTTPDIRLSIIFDT